MFLFKLSSIFSTLSSFLYPHPQSSIWASWDKIEVWAELAHGSSRTLFLLPFISLLPILRAQEISSMTCSPVGGRTQAGMNHQLPLQLLSFTTKPPKPLWAMVSPHILSDNNPYSVSRMFSAMNNRKFKSNIVNIQNVYWLPNRKPRLGRG